MFAGGDLNATVGRIGDEVLVIAADSGYDHARTAGVEVDLLIGDMDSISPEGLAHAEATGVTIDQHPTAKDATDLELAFDAAVTADIKAVDLYGGERGTLAHLLGVASLVASDSYAGLSIRWRTKTGDVFIVRQRTPLSAMIDIGTTVSIIPVTDATGVTTDGMEWSLDDASLTRGESTGLSNTSTRPEITVAVASGVLVVVVEGPTT
jgi:thiamine pyrophosphokinase